MMTTGSNEHRGFLERRVYKLYSFGKKYDLPVDARVVLAAENERNGQLLLRGLEYYRQTVNSAFDELEQDEDIQDALKSVKNRFRINDSGTQSVQLTRIRSVLDDFITMVSYDKYMKLVDSYRTKSYPFDGPIQVNPKKVAHDDSIEFNIMRDWLTCALFRVHATAEKYLGALSLGNEFVIERLRDEYEGEYVIPESLYTFSLDNTSESVSVSLKHSYSPVITGTVASWELYTDIVTLHHISSHLFSVSYPPVRLVIDRLVYDDKLRIDDIEARFTVFFQGSFLRHICVQTRDRYRFINKNSKPRPFYKPRLTESPSIPRVIIRSPRKRREIEG